MLRALVWLAFAAPVSGRRALCITGAARTFAATPVYSSILEHLKTPDTDVFAYVFESGPAFKDNNNIYCRQEGVGLDSIIQKFQPVLWKVYPSPTCPGLYPDCDSCTSSKGPLMQIGWVNQCFKQAETHAKLHGFEYEAYIRVRPDVHIDAPFPTSLDANTVYTGRKTDAPGFDAIFAMHASLYHSWWSKLCISCACMPQCCAEYHIFRGQNIVQVGELNAKLVRRLDRTECWDPWPRCGDEQKKAELIDKL